jgi:hypothetical protein
MYKYEVTRINGMQFAKTTANVGDVFRKVFPIDGATSSNQRALVAIIKGSFTFTVPDIGFSKTLTAGQTSLDLNIAYPKDAICEETPAEADSIRFCIKAHNDAELNKYVREVIALSTGQTVSVDTKNIVFVIKGSVDLKGNSFTTEAILDIVEDGVVTATTDSIVVIFRGLP